MVKLCVQKLRNFPYNILYLICEKSQRRFAKIRDISLTFFGKFGMLLLLIVVARG